MDRAIYSEFVMLAQSRKINILEKLAMDPNAAAKTKTIASAAGGALKKAFKPVKPVGNPNAAAGTAAASKAVSGAMAPLFKLKPKPPAVAAR